MNSIRQWIRDLFGFSGNEINGFVILIPIMVACVFSEPLYRRFTGPQKDNMRDSITLDSLVRSWGNPGTPPVFTEPFPFNPNTAAVAELRTLGFDETSSTRIAAYRSKGGVFRVKSDLLKIYGLDSTLYKQLYAFIRLPAALPAKTRTATAVNRGETKEWTSLNSTPDFDINTADTLLLKTVYGIGPRRAARIVKFRESLGGFVKMEQLYEVYGLDSTVVKELQEACFIKKDFIPKKIDINDASEKDLASHPYIRYKLARLLVSYRLQHGDFLEPNDIKKLSAMPSEEVDRLLPYITVNLE